jgi:hypothetical protein
MSLCAVTRVEGTKLIFKKNKVSKIGETPLSVDQASPDKGLQPYLSLLFV